MFLLTSRYRRLWIFLGLTIAVLLGPLGAFLLRFDFAIPAAQEENLVWAIALLLPIKLLLFYMAQLHKGWWSIVGIDDIKRLLAVNVLASLICTPALLAVRGVQFPRSIYLLDLLMTVALLTGARLGMRLHRENRMRSQRSEAAKRVLIYGAGWAGAGLAREIASNAALAYEAIGFIDDNPRKQDETMLGLRVLGSGREIPHIVANLKARNLRVDEILIAMPSATAREMRDAVTQARAAEVAVRTLPGIGDLLSNKGLTSQIREVKVEDLLCREPVELDELCIRHAIAAKAVMVTGAAGSIGSELCRQIAALNPKRLIAFDQAESPLFQIEFELRNHFPKLEFVAVIGDIRQPERIGETIDDYGIEAIFHAAAYKHVPMVERHVIDGVVNNIVGTWNVARLAYEKKVPNFLLISSDKAVNPTNVMGATKRVAELIVSSYPSPEDGGPTRFVSVRFGNVLASNGSVVPLFQQQIAAGGPVTVTHPEMRRFFMTIREAVQLVLQASTMGKGSEVFVLDMGEPVRILDLARNMIRLSGLRPDEDIEIKFTGIRPGEKLFEELLTESENIVPTYHSKIKIFRGPDPVRSAMDTWLRQLERAIALRDEVEVVGLISNLIPEYQVSREWSDRLRTRGIYRAASA